jgi:ribose/xylose/arabinose/galactoside ABC-type transport system permease subunit
VSADTAVAADDRPGRPGSALLAHVAWEAVLLVLAIAATGVAIAQGHFFAASGLWPQLAIDGLVAAGFALSLRTGTPNLAVAATASLAQLVYVLVANHNTPAVLAGVVAVLAAVGLGLALALVTGLTGLPAWAVSLAGIAVMQVVGFGQAGNIQALRNGLVKAPILDVFAVLFILGSVAGGALWTVPALRAALGPAGDPPGQQPPLARRLTRALAGFGGSSLLAGVSGVLLAGYVGAAGFTGDQTLLLLAVGAVLLGGVSLTGRGGGIAGTFLGVYILVVVEFIAAIHGGPLWLRRALPEMLAILLGLLAGGLLERVGAGRAGVPRTGTWTYRPPPG